MVKIIPSTDPLFRDYNDPETYDVPHEEKHPRRRKAPATPPIHPSPNSEETSVPEGIPRKEGNTRRTKSPERALESLMMLCAKSEKSLHDARQALFRWGVAPEEHDKILERLVKERFIDEQRYAAAYVREKGTLSRWGIHKIRAGLRAKRISEENIKEALEQLETIDLAEKLEEILRKKIRTTKAKNNYDLRGKLLRFGTSQGYDFSEMSDLLDKLIGEAELPDNDF